MYEEITPESIEQNILNALADDVDKREGSYTRSLIAPTAVELWKFYQSLNALLPVVYVDETSGEFIDKKCANYGILRKPGTKARAMLDFAGTDGTVIPRGYTFLTADGLEFLTLEKSMISHNTASVYVEAVEAGEKYNVSAGAITRQGINLSGLTGFTNDAAKGGTNPESDRSLAERLYARLQKPSTSGNIHDYEKWALEVDGVGAVKVFPVWNGPGTVLVLVAGTEKNPVPEERVLACAAHIEAERPIGASVTVKSVQPFFIKVSATVVLEASAAAEDVRKEMEVCMVEYLRDLAFCKYEIIYNRAALMLMNISGVKDYTEFHLNGTDTNLSWQENQVPVLESVVILS